MTVNDRVMYIMNAEKLTQKEFANILGISQPVLTYIASGRNKVSLDIVQKIAQKYPSINLRWLALGEGEMTNKTPLTSNNDLVKLIQEVEIVSNLSHSNLGSVITKLMKSINS